MTPPQNPPPRPPRPKSASPAERSAEFADTQRRLKDEAAQRRLEADKQGASPPRRSPRGR
jgi:hypothetical protein